MGNDTDPDPGDTLTGTLVTPPTHGTLTGTGDGAFTYTPTDPNFAGTDTFTYTVTDAGGLTSNVATVTINIASTDNDAPTAVNDTYNTTEGVPLSVPAPGLLANDTDPDPGDTLTGTLVTPPTHGTLTGTGDGAFTYTPTDPNFAGTDTFTYTVTDAGGLTSNVATVTINIASTDNDAPTAVNDTYNTTEGVPLSVPAPGPLGNDTDPDPGDTLTGTLVTRPTHGTLTGTGDGAFTYTPTDPNFAGTDTFTYTVTDAGGLTSNVATVTINIASTDNDAPTAVNDTATVAEGSLDNAINVLGNDTDPDPGDTRTITEITQPANGTVAITDTGTGTGLIYTPNTNFAGTDTFTYTITDAAGLSDAATVTVTVTNVDNDAPTAVNDTYNTTEGVPLSVPAPGPVGQRHRPRPRRHPDRDRWSLHPTHGTLTGTGDGAFTYTPTDPNFAGTDTFTYTVTDAGGLTSNVATVTINIASTDNDAPIAVNDTYNVDPNFTRNVPVDGVLDNDTDPDGDTLTAVLVTGPTNGTLALNADGSFTYTPIDNFTGTDSFTYTANDGALNSNTATVTINVTTVNNAPVANNDSYDAPNGILTVPAATGVLADDTDPDGDTLTAQLVDNPGNGTVILNPDGSFTYTPNASFDGTDSFTYRAFDGTTTGNIATVTITDNIAPTAVDVQAGTAGSAPSRLDQGDTITFTFSEPIDPSSIVAGWDGTGSTNVVVRLTDNGPLDDDRLEVYNATNSSRLSLGVVDMGRGDYVRATIGFGSVYYGATGTPSTMTISGNTVTVVLGTYSQNLGTRQHRGGIGNDDLVADSGVEGPRG